MLRKESEQGVHHVYTDLPSSATVGRALCPVLYNLLISFASLLELRFDNFRMWQKTFLYLCEMEQFSSPVVICLVYYVRGSFWPSSVVDH